MRVKERTTHNHNSVCLDNHSAQDNELIRADDEDDEDDDDDDDGLTTQ